MEGKNYRSIKVNAFFNTVRTVLSLAFPLITFPYVSRVLGVKQIGVYNFSQSVISYFLLIAALGISTYAVREGTRYRDNPSEMSRFASEMFTINLISAGVSYALLLVCLLLVRQFDAYRSEILIFSIQLMVTAFGVEWIYNIYEDFVYISVRSFAFQCISLVLMFLLVKDQGDVDRYVFVTVFSACGSNILNYIHSGNFCRIRITGKIDWKRHLRPIMVIFSTSVAVTIYVNSDTTMLGLMTDDYTVGIYSVSVKIYNIFKNVIVAFLVVLIPRFSLLAHESDSRQKISSLFSRISTVLITVAAPMIAGIFMLAPDVIHIVSGKQYIQSVASFRILMLACLFSFFAYLFSQCILIPCNRENDFFKATVVSAVVNIGLNFIMIPCLHEAGAAVTTLLAELITMVMVFWFSRPYVDLRIKPEDLWSVITGTLLIIVICAICNGFVHSMICRLMAEIIISSAVYWIILEAFHNTVLREIEMIVINRLKKFSGGSV